jgi:hypothetical protein
VGSTEGPHSGYAYDWQHIAKIGLEETFDITTKTTHFRRCLTGSVILSNYTIKMFCKTTVFGENDSQYFYFRQNRKRDSRGGGVKSLFRGFG